jgi:hypothetical protein
MSMYKGPTGPVGTLHQALRKDLQNIPTPDPTPETAKRMAEVLSEIAEAMRAAEVSADHLFNADRHDQGTYWRRCS